MLVLSRKSGQEIVVPSCGMTLTILQVRGDRVRVGIEAPANVMIHRREFWERIKDFKAQDSENDRANAMKPARPAPRCTLPRG
jgi:carbon storage regulator